MLNGAMARSEFKAVPVRLPGMRARCGAMDPESFSGSTAVRTQRHPIGPPCQTLKTVKALACFACGGTHFEGRGPEGVLGPLGKSWEVGTADAGSTVFRNSPEAPCKDVPEHVCS